MLESKFGTRRETESNLLNFPYKKYESPDLYVKTEARAGRTEGTDSSWDN